MHKTTGEAGGTTAGEVERLVRLYSDSILRLSYSYRRTTRRTSVRTSCSSC